MFHNLPSLILSIFWFPNLSSMSLSMSKPHPVLAPTWTPSQNLPPEQNHINENIQKCVRIGQGLISSQIYPRYPNPPWLRSKLGIGESLLVSETSVERLSLSETFFSFLGNALIADRKLHSFGHLEGYFLVCNIILTPIFRICNNKNRVIHPHELQRPSLGTSHQTKVKV